MIPMEQRVQQAMKDFDAKQGKQPNGRGAESTQDAAAQEAKGDYKPPETMTSAETIAFLDGLERQIRHPKSNAQN